ncbi:MAG TPA: DUF4861 family protein [Pricia sp.]|nr:DUF4861 family protein [Pricia sp.]
MHFKQFLYLLLAGTIFTGCAEQAAPKKKIYVKNTMDADRSLETVSLPIDSLYLKGTEGNEGAIVIIDDATQKPIVSQIIDADGDGTDDTILFQPKVKANSESVFTVTRSDSTATTSGSDALATSNDSVPRCYSRFVPERTDDYAWENNRVAFRTYGPTAQKMFEDEVKGGTLSSGIDAWLKRVEYPIINKWYKKELETDGSYHEDTGEGLDNFHVGVSRGVGGIAVKADDTYHVSKNFTSWERLYNGPIRTSFILTYADWDAAGKKISEEKHISLDYGSNLSRFEIEIKGADTISAGLTLHEGKGTTGVEEQEGWISYWEPHEDSELGTGIVVPGGQMVGHEKYESDEKDRSNLFAHIQLNEEGKAVYYVGFGWKKSGRFETQAEWKAYLSQFSKKLKNPLVVEVR